MMQCRYCKKHTVSWYEIPPEEEDYIFDIALKYSQGWFPLPTHARRIRTTFPMVEYTGYVCSACGFGWIEERDVNGEIL